MRAQYPAKHHKSLILCFYWLDSNVGFLEGANRGGSSEYLDRERREFRTEGCLTGKSADLGRGADLKAQIWDTQNSEFRKQPLPGPGVQCLTRCVHARETKNRTKEELVNSAPSLNPLTWNAICSLYPGQGNGKTMPGPHLETAGMQSVNTELSSLQQPDAPAFFQTKSLFYSVLLAFVEYLTDTLGSRWNDPLRLARVYLSFQSSVQSHSWDKKTPVKFPMEF